MIVRTVSESRAVKVGRRRARVSIALAALGLAAWGTVGCGGSAGAESTTSAPLTTQTVLATSTTAAAAATVPISEMETQTLRELAFAYWEAFNAYDVDKTLSLLEETYRAQRAEKIGGEISRIKAFGVKLGVSEKSAPVLINADSGEMYLALKEPLGTRTIHMEFSRTADDSWVITSAEEVE